VCKELIQVKLLNELVIGTQGLASARLRQIEATTEIMPHEG
jgi:hypothetical protein